jgi:hypothetical protein
MKVDEEKVEVRFDLTPLKLGISSPSKISKIGI